MKTKIKRHSRSVISVLLAVCMIISCMTVGIIATDAAKTQSESVGALPSTIYFIPNTAWYNSGNVVMKANFNNNGSSYNAVTMTLEDASTMRYSVSVPSSVNKVQFLRGSTGEWNEWDYSKNVDIPTDGKNLFTLDSGWKDIGGTWTTYSEPVTPTATDVSLTANPSIVGSGVSTDIKLTAAATAASGANLQYTFYKGDTALGAAQSGNTFTATAQTLTADTTYKVVVSDSTAGTEYGDVEATDTVCLAHDVYIYGDQFGGWSWDSGNPAATIKKMTYDPTTDAYYYDADITAGTNKFCFWDDTDNDTHYHPSSSTKVIVDDENHTSVSTTGYSTEKTLYTEGLTGDLRIWFSLAEKKAWVENPFDYTAEGFYSLTGNVTDRHIVGSTLVKPSGVTENVWWATYHEETAINTPVPGEPGKFYITFTTADYNGDINVGLAGVNNRQYAFIYNGTPYNGSGNTSDLSVTTSITDGLYVYDFSGAGSLVLQPNTTYTVTIDQTAYFNNDTSNPVGKITVDATTVYANAVAMVKPFDATGRRPGDIEKSNAGGTVSVASDSSTDSTSGDKTTATVTHAKPMTATYTASAASAGYTFEGWYSDKDCTTKVSDALSYSPDEFNVTKTLYALYSENVPTQSYDVAVTKAGTGSGSISVTGAAVKEESGNTVTYTAYVGATVTVTATPDTTPLSVLTSITGDGTVSGNTATIENIAADKVLTVTFTEKTTYTVTLKGTNGTVSAISYQADGTTQYATASATNNGTIEVPIGGTVKLTAAAETGYEFSNWALTAGKYKRKANQSLDSSPVTIRPTDDMTAEAKFGTAGASSGWYVDFTHHSAPTTSNPNLKKYTGLKVKGFNDDSTKDVYYAKFTLKSGANKFHMWDGTRDYKFTSDQVVTFDNNYYPQATNNGYQNATHPGEITVDADTEVYVYAMYNTQDKELKIRFTKTKAHGDSSTISTDGYQRIYAMDGTLGSTAGYGDTVITIGNGLLEKDIEDASGNSELYVDAHTNHNVYYFDPNQNISFRVQTTVDSAQTKLGVRGFVYNGKSVDAIDNGDGVYYADITVKANSVLDINGGTTNNPILEVIPVYYNTTVPANEFITFYVDANTMDNKFGYNIGYYIWYQGSGNEVQGKYPGQPLLRSGTKYVGYIPKHYVSNTETYSDSTNAFSGVLLNNLHENSSVHDECLESWGCDKINYQTFDYEDPYVISQIEDVDTIEFVAKFEETNSNHQSGTHWYNSTYNKAELKGKTSGYAFPSDISAPNSASQLNGFELLRNFDNKPVDVYGNELSTVNFADSVFIISVGNQDNGSANDWDTVWMIYQGGTGDHTLIKGDIPSSFINVAENSQLPTLKQKPVYISYEKFLDGSENVQTHSSDGSTGNTGDRIDGRWLYTKSTDETNGRIRVATLGKNNDTLSFLTYDEGASGARIAYYDNSVDGITQNGNSTKEDSYGRKTTFANRTTTAKAVLNEPIGYKIKGFYMLKTGVSGSDNGFSYSISDYDEMVRESATVAKYTNARDTWIVAVVEPVPASNLYLKHEMYGGPGAHSGAGDFYIKADVVNANGTVVATSGDFVDGNDGYEFEHLNSVVQKGQGYKIKVTLRTVMAGTNTFYSWFTSDLATGDYDKEITTNSAGNNARGQNTPQETVIEVSVDDLFGSKTDGSFEYTNLAYYSDIDMGGSVHVTHQKLAASLGDGTFETKIAIVNGGTETVIQDYKSGTVSVPASYTKRNSGNSIRIYLRTTPDAYSTYSNTFSDSSGTTAVTPPATVTDGVAVIQLADIPVSSLYINKGTEQKPSYEFDTTKSSYNYYTNLSKNTLKYTIQYNYNSAEYGMQSYTVTDVFTNAEMSKYVQAKTYTDQDKTSDDLTGAFFEMNPATRAEFLGLKSPYEKNVHINFEWKFNNASYKNYKGNNEISIVVNSSNGNMRSHNAVLKFPFEVSVVTNDGLVCKTETVDGENRIIDIGDAPSSDAEHYTKQITVSAPHGHVYTLSKGTPTNPVFITAPSVIYKSNAVDAAKEYFKYWSIKKTASDTGNEVEVAKCYFVGFNYSLYEDYIVEPVYGNTPSGSADQEITNYDNSSTISFVENGRNQWNSLGGDAAYNNGDILKNQNKWPYGDRIFSNFVISFNRKDNKMIKSSPELKVTTGVIFDRVTEVKMDETTGLAVNNPAEYGITNDGKTNIETYISGGFNAEDVPAGGEYLNTIINNSKIDNKNRIELTKAFPNISHNTGENTGRKNYLYRAYSYMIEEDGSYVISDPVYFTFYDIASIANGSTQS